MITAITSEEPPAMSEFKEAVRLLLFRDIERLEWAVNYETFDVNNVERLLCELKNAIADTENKFKIIKEGSE